MNKANKKKEESLKRDLFVICNLLKLEQKQSAIKMFLIAIIGSLSYVFSTLLNSETLLVFSALFIPSGYYYLMKDACFTNKINKIFSNFITNKVKFDPIDKNIFLCKSWKGSFFGTEPVKKEVVTLVKEIIGKHPHMIKYLNFTDNKITSKETIAFAKKALDDIKKELLDGIKAGIYKNEDIKENKEENKDNEKESDETKHNITFPDGYGLEELYQKFEFIKDELNKGINYGGYAEDKIKGVIDTALNNVQSGFNNIIEKIEAKTTLESNKDLYHSKKSVTESLKEIEKDIKECKKNIEAMLKIASNLALNIFKNNTISDGKKNEAEKDFLLKEIEKIINIVNKIGVSRKSNKTDSENK